MILFAGFVIAESFATRAKATEFLNDVKNLRPGRSSLGDLLHLKEKYNKFASLDSSGCVRNHCTVYFYFDNRWLYRVRAVAPVRFGGGVTVRDGTVCAINLALASNASYSAQVVDALAIPSEPPYVVSGRRSTSDGAFIDLKVHLTPAAPEQMRQNAYSFNLSCLTRFGGCKGGHAMLPKV
jgi:hypothetical protein